MKNRRAFSLIEMLVCISVGSVLVALSIGLVHRSMRNDSTMRSVVRVERTAARLSSQFRQDVHQSRAVSLDEPDSGAFTIQLQLIEQPAVSYRLEGSRLIREQRLSSGGVHREIFAFPSDHVLQFSERQDPHRIVLKVQRDNELLGVSPQWKLHVEAVVGRFLDPAAAKEVSQ